MKYFELTGGHYVNDLYEDMKWYRSVEDKLFCGGCLKLFPGVTSFDVFLNGNHPPFSLSELGGVFVGIAHVGLISQLNHLFNQVFYVSNLYKNGQLAEQYKIFFQKSGVYNLRGDKTSLNEPCKCGRRKYYPKIQKGRPYMLRQTIPPEGICRSNLNYLILREDLLNSINWTGLPRPKIRQLAIRDTPLDGDPEIF